MDIELGDSLNKQWKNDKTTHIVKVRETGLGLDIEESADGAGNKTWSETADSFNAVSKGLNKKDKKKKAEKSAKVTTISVGMK